MSAIDFASIASLLCAAFFAILFFQSSIDKNWDREGNLEWMTSHFSQSPLKNHVPLALTFITYLELACGIMNALLTLGLAADFFAREFETSMRFYAQITFSFVGLTFLALFTGQRLAKDYAGAASLAGYFAVALLGLHFASGIGVPVTK